MTHDEKQKLRMEGFKAAIAIVRRMAQERGGDDYWTAHAFLKTQGRHRFEDFDGE